MRTLKALCDTVRFVDDRPSAGEFEFDLSRQIAHFESQALEVRPGTSPRLHAMLQTVTERLQLDAPIRCFISSEPTPNACAWIGSSSEVIIELHAGLVRLCDGDDLAYVIGHEIGHVGLRHGDPDGGPERGSLAWRYRRRCAEISADRVGMIAARSTLACAKAVMKLASGLPIEFLRIDVEAYLEQVTQDASSCHVLSTHPSLPVRLRALEAFATSRVYRSLTGQGVVGREMGSVDGEVRQMLAQAGDDRVLAERERVRNRVRAIVAWMILGRKTLGPADRDAALRGVLGPELARLAAGHLDAVGVAAAVARLREAAAEWSALEPGAPQALQDLVREVACALAMPARAEAILRMLARDPRERPDAAG